MALYWMLILLRSNSTSEIGCYDLQKISTWYFKVKCAELASHPGGNAAAPRSNW